MIDSGIYTAWLPKVDDEAILKTDMDGLTGVNEVNVFIPSDKIVLVTIGFNVQKCHSNKPKQNCQFMHNGMMAAEMKNVSFEWY